MTSGSDGERGEGFPPQFTRKEFIDVNLTGTVPSNIQQSPYVQKRKQRLKKKLLPWLFVLPTLLLTILVIAGPAFGTLILSFTDWDGIAPPNYVGLENFKTLLADETFYAALSNNLKWMALFCTVPISLALVIAVLVSKVKRGQMVYRTLFFLPNIVSTVVSARIWMWIYNPFVGINTVFEAMGFTAFASIYYLGDPALALYAVAVTDGWRYWGFLFVLFLSALHQTDRSLEEAGLIEGASRFQIFWYITLPQLRPTVMLILMLTMIWSFAAFDYIFLMTSGGPGHASEILGTYMYKLALYNQRPGYASTVALAMALFSLIIMMGFGILKKRGWDI